MQKALDDKMFAGGVFIDFEKAFDRAFDNLLVTELTQYGI